MSWSSKTGSISSTPENVTLNSAIILPGLTKRRRKSMIVALFWEEDVEKYSYIKQKDQTYLKIISDTVTRRFP